ncbi:MAG: STAS domain-containing protein [Planctomycetota bacterium]
MADTSPIRTSREGAVVRVSFTERKIIDEVVIHQIGQEILKLVDAEATPKVVLDFAGVEHLSSAALGVLISVHNRVKSRSGQLRLCANAKPIFEVFRITKLDKLFQVHETADAAAQSLA